MLNVGFMNHSSSSVQVDKYFSYKNQARWLAEKFLKSILIYTLLRNIVELFSHEQAYLCYMEALRIQPTFAIAWSNLAGLFMEAGDYAKALAYYKVTI